MATPQANDDEARPHRLRFDNSFSRDEVDRPCWAYKTMKIKVNVPSAGDGDGEPSSTPTASTAAEQPTRKPSVKISFKPAADDAAPPAQAPKPKRQYNKKPKADKDVETASPETTKKPASRKRKAKDKDADGEEAEVAKPAVKRVKSGITLKLGAAAAKATSPEPPAPTTNVPKIRIPGSQPQEKLAIKFKPKAAVPVVGHQRVSLKARGRPPPRPVGQGYDSEGEDIEVDPAIESQIILSFDGIPDTHGDIEYIHRMIDERKVGLKLQEGGADISIRFFAANDVRRAVVTVRGRRYAAILVDLPCVIESMKGWDKKNWWKVADICQKLLVVGLVSTDDEAKTYPIPAEVDPKHWLYPHGLTPPMHWVRKRRFRHRVSRKRIEEIEAAVQALLLRDEEFRAAGGTVKYEFVDPGQEEEEEDGEGEEEEYANGDGGGYVDGTEQEVTMVHEDDDVLAQMLQEGFEGLDEGAEVEVVGSPAGITPSAALDSGITPDTALQTGITSDSGVTPTALSQDGSHDATPGETGADTGDDDEGDEEDDDNEVDEDDEEERARQEERAEMMEEIADLKKEIAAFEEQARKQTNPMLKKRAVDKARSLGKELELKMASLGEGDGEE